MPRKRHRLPTVRVSPNLRRRRALGLRPSKILLPLPRSQILVKQSDAQLRTPTHRGLDRLERFAVGDEDVGVACEALDGRGGIDIRRDVLPVHDPFFAGASLTAGGAVMANAYGPDFEIVRWDETSGDAQRWPSPGPGNRTD